MKILQPSNRSKRSSKSVGETDIPTKSERFSESNAVSNQTNAKKLRRSSERASSGLSRSSYSKNSGGSSDNALWSKKRRRKSKYRNSFPNSDDLQDLKVAEKDSEFDFDTSKLEAMPRSDELGPAPHLEGKKRRRSELEVHAPTESLELIVDPAKKEYRELLARGIRLLAMREHSVTEITNKLLDKSENVDAIHAAVEELQEKKYLSDERFAESYIRYRANRGFGPVKIKSELKAKGVSNSLIQDYLDEGDAVWFDIAQAQYLKKYGDSPIADYSSWTKRARFMQSRGFNMEQINCVAIRPDKY